jgi:hypothetical protein
MPQKECKSDDESEGAQSITDSENSTVKPNVY